MAAGKPVLGAKVGGIPEIIVDGKNGLLFENENIDDLVSKLDKLIKDKKLRLQMGVKGQQILAQKFSSGKMTENFLDLVRNVTTEQ
jgi:glycosyltransferase involved in cell wall biosynthesis